MANKSVPALWSAMTFMRRHFFTLTWDYLITRLQDNFMGSSMRLAFLRWFLKRISNFFSFDISVLIDLEHEMQLKHICSFWAWFLVNFSDFFNSSLLCHFSGFLRLPLFLDSFGLLWFYFSLFTHILRICLNFKSIFSLIFEKLSWKDFPSNGFRFQFFQISFENRTFPKTKL